MAPIRGSQQLQAMQLDHPVTHLVTVRFTTRITAAHRFIHDGTILAIRALKQRDGRKRFLEALCEENLREST